MSENTAHKPKIKKRSSFPLFPPKPSGAAAWFYTFMCMNIPSGAGRLSVADRIHDPAVKHGTDRKKWPAESPL